MNHRITRLGREIVRRHKTDLRKKQACLFKEIGKIIMTEAGILEIRRPSLTLSIKHGYRMKMKSELLC